MEGPHPAGKQTSSAPDRQQPRGTIEDNDRRQALLAAAMKPRGAEIRQPGKSEFQRLREEVLGIAQGLESLRPREPRQSGAAGFAPTPPRQEARPRTESIAKPHGAFRSSELTFGTRQKQPDPLAVRLAPSDPAQAGKVRYPELRSSPSGQRPRVPDEKRHDLIDPAHRNVRPGGVDPAARTVPPARTEAPRLAVGAHEPVRPAPAQSKTPVTLTNHRSLSLSAKFALLVLLMLAGTGLITVKLWGGMPGLQAMHGPIMSWLTPARQKVADMLARVPLLAAKETAPQTSANLTTASLPTSGRSIAPSYHFAAPDTYGVYAGSDGQLTPLEALPFRVPDARVSISSPISKPAPTPIANGRLFFVVYHRELATSVPENASVRIVAKVVQATAFAGGKPKAVAVEDTWMVRGGAIDLRIAPVPGNPEMVVVRPADRNFTLSPGRYVLMFKNQAYDFSVAGTVSDTAQCLERADLQDKSIYSECRELPARPISF
ncbi:MAG: hypothetical protein ACRED3_00735 [Bradyrhizobium sp.]